MLFSPKHQAVVKGELKHAADCDERPLVPSPRPAHATHHHQRTQNKRSQNEADAGEGKRRKIVQTNLDEEPGRSPDAAEDQPDDARSHLVSWTSGSVSA